MLIHVINKQCFEVNCAHEQDARVVQHEIEHFTAPEINRIINAVFNDLNQPGTNLRFEKLIIDLGSMTAADFGNGFMLDKFRQVLETALHVHSPEVNTFASHAYATNGQSPFFEPVFESEQVMIDHLLHTGDVPWWVSKTEVADPDTILQRLVKEQSGLLKNLLFGAQNNPQVLLRISSQFKPATQAMLFELLPALLPGVKNKTLAHDQTNVFALQSLNARQLFILEELLVSKKPLLLAKIKQALLSTEQPSTAQQAIAEWITLSEGTDSKNEGTAPEKQAETNNTPGLDWLIQLTRLTPFQLELLLYILSHAHAPAINTVLESAAGFCSFFRDYFSVEHEPGLAIVQLAGSGLSQDLFATEKDKALSKIPAPGSYLSYPNTTQHQPVITPGISTTPEQNKTLSKIPVTGSHHAHPNTQHQPVITPAGLSAPEQKKVIEKLVATGFNSKNPIAVPPQPVMPGVHFSANDSTSSHVKSMENATIPDATNQQIPGADTSMAILTGHREGLITPAVIPETPLTFSHPLPVKEGANETGFVMPVADTSRFRDGQLVEEVSKSMAEPGFTGDAGAPLNLSGNPLKTPANAELQTSHHLSANAAVAGQPGAAPVEQRFDRESTADNISSGFEQLSGANQPLQVHTLDALVTRYPDDLQKPPVMANMGHHAAVGVMGEPVSTQQIQYPPGASALATEKPFVDTVLQQAHALQSAAKNKLVHFILKKLNSNQPALLAYLQQMGEKELLEIKALFKNHIHEKIARGRLITLIADHPYFFKYKLFTILAHLAPEEGGQAPLANTTKKKKLLITAVSEKLRVFQEHFHQVINHLSQNEEIVLKDILEKQRFDTTNEKSVIKKILLKLPEEGIRLLHFLIQLPEQDLQQLFTSNATSFDQAAASTNGFKKNRSHYTYEKADHHPVFHIENAGLCLVALYLPGFFKNIGYLETRNFKNKAYATRALYLLQYIATGTRKTPEYLLQFNKLLCGFEADDYITTGIRFTKKEIAEADNLVIAILANWKALKNTTTDGFRSSFLERKGILSFSETCWTLQVEKKGFDLLLEPFHGI